MPAGDRPTRVACDLDLVYPPRSGREYSFEEIKFGKGVYESEMASWGGWEWAKEWDEEVQRTGGEFVSAFVMGAEADVLGRDELCLGSRDGVAVVVRT